MILLVIDDDREGAPRTGGDIDWAALIGDLAPAEVMLLLDPAAGIVIGMNCASGDGIV